MPEINQYQFKHKEVLEALVRHAGLHEGKWQLIATFSLAAANVGPTQDEVSPAAVVAVTGVGLQRAMDGSPEALVIDAAEVNPTPK